MMNAWVLCFRACVVFAATMSALMSAHDCGAKLMSSSGALQGQTISHRFGAMPSMS